MLACWQGTVVQLNFYRGIDRGMDLEQFCILASSQKGLACSALVQQALSSRKIFVFGELLALPSVNELKSSEHAKCFNTLELFAYGKVRDYIGNHSIAHLMLITFAYSEDEASYLELSEIQMRKLKQVTLLSLAAECSQLSYDYIMRELFVDDLRVLEDIIIDSIYTGLIQAKLDQRNRMVYIFDFASRDVRPRDIDSLIDSLVSW